MVNRWKVPAEASPDLLGQILKHRGLKSDELGLSLKDMPDESLLAGIEEVAERLRRALYKNEALVIFGHDDPDGVTSTYILYQFLNSCGYQKHRYYIPNRNLEPHGIQASVIDFVRQGGYKLLITVDNGISAWEGVTELNKLGCEVLITDHHLIQPDHLPPAYAILNPQLPHCQYPYKSLAGVGVVLLLIRYLSRLLEHEVPHASYFWAAVGSIADKVPMTGVNRLIVREVIENWDKVRDYTIDFLLRNYMRVDSPSTIFNFIQNTARLIANGREPGGEHTAIRFMLQVSDEKADLFQELEQQKNLWEQELNKVFGFMDSLVTDFVGPAFVYYDDEGVIPYNLLGTAATYVVNNLDIPTIMLKMHNGAMVCEGRCSDGFNMVSAFTHCRDHLIQYGGHAKAAGFTMDPVKYDAFLACFNEFLNEALANAEEPQKIAVDARIKAKDLSPENWEKLEVLLPWGMKNPEPLIMVDETSLQDLQSRFMLDNGGQAVKDQRANSFIISWKSPNLIKILDHYEA
ncbi:MAG: DHH family phosphoesterase [Candidatus Cloacimonetes bacterium HGW-Cloacimonetes-2]|jgi:single-stranded-DNA-specific exonuclease|nr:MAG: DHH family phosphoesterase [Candidatus Cloacimonetes bacterium HGW-Cloacimonetes-2]